MQYMDECLVIAESESLLLQHREQLFQLCQVLEIVIKWEKSDLKPPSRASYFRMLIDTIWERVFLMDSRIVRFRYLADKSLLLLSLPTKMWQQLLGHMGSLEQFVPRGQARMYPLQWQLKAHWSPTSNDSAVPVPLSQECRKRIAWWFQEERWTSGVPLQVSSPLLLHTDASLIGWSTQLLNRTAAGVWSWEEKDPHINV